MTPIAGTARAGGRASRREAAAGAPPAPKAPEMVVPEPTAKPAPKPPPKPIEKPVDKSRRGSPRPARR